jgi:hypothetical protein
MASAPSRNACATRLIADPTLAEYEPDAAELILQRTLAFLERYAEPAAARFS